MHAGDNAFIKAQNEQSLDIPHTASFHVADQQLIRLRRQQTELQSLKARLNQKTEVRSAYRHIRKQLLHFLKKAAYAVEDAFPFIRFAQPACCLVSLCPLQQFFPGSGFLQKMQDGGRHLLCFSAPSDCFLQGQQRYKNALAERIHLLKRLLSSGCVVVIGFAVQSGKIAVLLRHGLSAGASAADAGG